MGGSTDARREHTPIEAAYAVWATDLTAFATGLVGPDDAADVVATTMARIVAAGRWEDVRQPRAYLYRAVYREAVSVRRQFVRRARLTDRLRARPGPVASTEPDPVDPAMAAAIRALPARQRAVILLTYWQDLPPEQVAAHLGISSGSVRKHLARARASLRGALT